MSDDTLHLQLVTFAAKVRQSVILRITTDDVAKFDGLTVTLDVQLSVQNLGFGGTLP